MSLVQAAAFLIVLGWNRFDPSAISNSNWPIRRDLFCDWTFDDVDQVRALSNLLPVKPTLSLALSQWLLSLLFRPGRGKSVLARDRTQDPSGKCR